MTLDELVSVLAEPLPVGVVLTDAGLDAPGPLVRYVNPAFCRLSGYAADELVGMSPRRLQGEATQPLVLRTLSRSLRAGARFHGVLVNYRKGGERYFCEIDARPLVADERRRHRPLHRLRARGGAPARPPARPGPALPSRAARSRRPSPRPRRPAALRRLKRRDASPSYRDHRDKPGHDK
jgi:PAS domain S-box-containing protein